jgi:hypothetical protein
MYSNIESGEESHFLGVDFVLCSQSGNDPQEHLARFGYKLNMKVKSLKNPSNIFGYIHEPCTVIWRVERRVLFLGQFCVM